MNKYNFEEAKTIAKTDNIGIWKTVRIILLICIICFFLPFVTVSCSSTEVTASGIEIASGIFSDEYLQEDIPFNIFVAISLISTLAAFAVAKRYNKNLSSALSILSAVCLVGFMISFKEYYNFDKDDMRYITIDYHLSIWVIIILHGISCVLLNGDKKLLNVVGKAKKETIISSKIKDCNDPEIKSVHKHTECEPRGFNDNAEIYVHGSSASRLKSTMRTTLTTSGEKTEEQDGLKGAGDL